MATIPELATLLRQKLGPTRFWYDIELKDALLEALRVWQATTGAITRTVTGAPEGTRYETIPGQVACPIRVTFGGAAGELDQSSLWELDEGSVGWEGEAAGAPSYWALNGFGQVVFSPRPSAALGEVSYEGIADILRGDAEGVELKDLSPGDLEVVLGYAQHYLSFKEGQGELNNTSGKKDGLYQRAAAANARLRRTNFYRSAMGKDNAEVEGSRSLHKPEGGMR